LTIPPPGDEWGHRQPASSQPPEEAEKTAKRQGESRPHRGLGRLARYGSGAGSCRERDRRGLSI